MLEVGRAIAERVPVVLMCYTNTILARGLERFADALLDSRRERADRPRPAARGGAGRARARATRAGLALVPLVAPTTPDERLARIGARARGVRLRRVGDRHHRRAHRWRRKGWRPCWRAPPPAPTVPVAVGFGISTPEQAAAAAAAGADGVIVGSRLVRAAGEAGEEWGSGFRGRRARPRAL